MQKKNFLIVVMFIVLSVILLLRVELSNHIESWIRGYEEYGDNRENIDDDDKSKHDHKKKKYVVSNKKDIYLELSGQKKYIYKDRDDTLSTNQGSYMITDDRIVLNDGTEFFIKDDFVFTEDRELGHAEGNSTYKIFFKEQILDEEIESIEDAIYNWLKDIENAHPELPKIDTVNIDIIECYYYANKESDSENISCNASFKMKLDDTAEDFDDSRFEELIAYAGEGLYYDGEYVLGGGVYLLDRTLPKYKTISRSSAP